MAFDSSTIGPFAHVILPVASSIAFIIIWHSFTHGYRKLSVCTLLWFISAVFIAKSEAFLSDPDHWQSSDYGLSFGILCSTPFVVFYLVWDLGLKQYVLCTIPSWVLIIMNTFRVSGGLYYYMYYTSKRTDFMTWQTGALDLFVGFTAIPLALIVKKSGLQNCKFIVMSWHAMGIWDLVSAFAAYTLNWLGVFKMAKEMTIFAFYPFSMIVLFQVQIFMLIHFSFLAFFDEMASSQLSKKRD